MLMLRLLRSLTFNTLMWMWTVFVALSCLPFMIAPRSWLVWGLEVWASGIMFLLRTISGVDYEICGHEHLPDGPVVYAIKHQSMWDTIILHLLVKDPAIVLKRELSLIPVYGWIAKRIGMIPVDRDNGASALKKMVADAKASAARGQSIAIFPEGTRAEPGVTPDYKPGVGALYTQLGLPVVPVALNSGLYWGRRSFTKYTGHITVQILPAIPAGLKRKPFMIRLEQDIESATEKLVEAAKAAR